MFPKHLHQAFGCGLIFISTLFHVHNCPIVKALLLFYHEEAKIGGNYGVIQGHITISDETRT